MTSASQKVVIRVRATLTRKGEKTSQVEALDLVKNNLNIGDVFC
jgi:hypothetical protein